MPTKSKGSVIKMQVVIGQQGMQQGLAFNPSVLLLKNPLDLQRQRTPRKDRSLRSTQRHTSIQYK
jgi:hypothetical protein